MHVPVSRVEPFTRVYNSANTKTDGLFEGLRGGTICVPYLLNPPVTRGHVATRELRFSASLERNRISAPELKIVAPWTSHKPIRYQSDSRLPRYRTTIGEYVETSEQ